MNRPDGLVVAVAALLLAGCGGLAPAPDGTPAGTAAPLGEDWPDSVQQGPEVTVDEVVDGDTIDVRYRNGTTDTVRLLGVDTPEVRGDNQPGEFEGVPDTEAGRACLRDAGENASAFARERLAGETVRLAFDPHSDRRDRYDRLLAYVVADGADVNYRLVAAGHARVYDTAFARSDAYYAAESEAQGDGRGVWACRNPDDGATSAETAGNAPLAIAEIHADAAGNDNENLNDEYVVFENSGGESLNLSGWTVSDDAGHTYAFPDGFELDSGETVTLYSGSGKDSGGDLYWGRTGAVWNNGGDTVVISDSAGRVVASESHR